MMHHQGTNLGGGATAWRLLASIGLLSACIVFRRELTATMALHMLVHLPAIILAGVMAAWAVAGGRRTVPDRCGLPGSGQGACSYNEQGIPGLMLVTLVLAYWMIPKALDDAVASEWTHSLKFFSLFVAGIVLWASLRQARNVVKLFFLGNFSWMTAIIGVLYQDHATRLCNFYLLGDQAWAGIGLVAYAAVLPIGAVAAYYVKDVKG
ncbi:MAG TPA: hypothetical protein VL001_11030 [Candidimonas sp.]|nr:hypothetical protein [Candidimonas sp.]